MDVHALIFSFVDPSKEKLHAFRLWLTFSFSVTGCYEGKANQQWQVCGDRRKWEWERPPWGVA